MKVNVVLDNGTFYDVNKFDIRIGQRFKIELTEIESKQFWFADNDPVLFVEVADDNKSAIITAKVKGECNIQLQQPMGQTNKSLIINVFDNVAIDLNLRASEPELK